MPPAQARQITSNQMKQIAEEIAYVRGMATGLELPTTRQSLRSLHTCLNAAKPVPLLYQKALETVPEITNRCLEEVTTKKKEMLDKSDKAGDVRTRAEKVVLGIGIASFVVSTIAFAICVELETAISFGVRLGVGILATALGVATVAYLKITGGEKTALLREYGKYYDIEHQVRNLPGHIDNALFRD